MFKKIEIWILYLTILIGVIFAFIFGVLVRQETEGITKVGSFSIEFLTRPAAKIARLPEQLLKEIFVEPFRADDPWKAQKEFYKQIGFNGKPDKHERYLLLSRYDGDIRQGVVELVDLRNFRTLHTWNPDINYINSLITNVGEFKNIQRDDHDSRKMLVHPLLTSDSGLLFGWYSPLRKIDACSNLIFQLEHDVFHHSIEEDADGNLWVPAHLKPVTIPKSKVGDKYLDDGIVKMSPSGEVLFSKSVSEIFMENNMEYLLFATGDMRFTKNPIHLNDIQPINTDSNFWKKGDIFLSLRHQSMIILYRPATNKILWKSTGHFYHQHDVDVLDANRISIFNNNSKDFINGDVVDGHNEVVIFNFKTKKYSSYLAKSLAQEDVKTIFQGRSEILPNGDLFFEETDNGRILFFNSDGSLKWSYVNGSKNKKVYQLGWSRILHTTQEINNVKNIIKNKTSCT